jgi:hypothetical protein
VLDWPSEDEAAGVELALKLGVPEGLAEDDAAEELGLDWGVLEGLSEDELGMSNEELERLPEDATAAAVTEEELDAGSGVLEGIEDEDATKVELGLGVGVGVLEGPSELNTTEELGLGPGVLELGEATKELDEGSGVLEKAEDDRRDELTALNDGDSLAMDEATDELAVEEAVKASATLEEDTASLGVGEGVEELATIDKEEDSLAVEETTDELELIAGRVADEHPVPVNMPNSTM